MNLIDIVNNQNKNSKNSKCPDKFIEFDEMITDFWNNPNEKQWLLFEEKYWNLVSPKNLILEKEIDSLNSLSVEIMSSNKFYDFLHDKYFVWKYTAPNRLATTRKNLEKHSSDLSSLQIIHNQLFSFDLNNISEGLKIATKIKGLGVAGGSGLLAILFPEYFATVDQFVVKSLVKIRYLKEHDILSKMSPESLTGKDGELLILIMRNKSNELNNKFKTNYWTPRKIDKILWAIGR